MATDSTRYQGRVTPQKSLRAVQRLRQQRPKLQGVTTAGLATTRQTLMLERPALECRTRSKLRSRLRTFSCSDISVEEHSEVAIGMIWWCVAASR